MDIKDRRTPHVVGIHLLPCQISIWFSIVHFLSLPNQTKSHNVLKTCLVVCTLVNQSLEWVRELGKCTHGFTLWEASRLQAISTSLVASRLRANTSLAATPFMNWTIASCWNGVDRGNNAIGWKDTNVMKWPLCPTNGSGSKWLRVALR